LTEPVSNGSVHAFRQRLLLWYKHNARPLPWRLDHHPWRVLVSEIMLQQTRVEAVIPFYQRFLARFPDPASLAAAPESELLALWSGLGYYSRARNLQKAARLLSPAFPSAYPQIRDLPGVGPYTAAAVASIGFGLPHAAVDGNVVRVLARLTCDHGVVASSPTRRRLETAAQALLDPLHPGDFNQAMMELGATLCLPRNPRCLLCPVAAHCQARRQGKQNELPVKLRKAPPDVVDCSVLVVQRQGSLLLRQRPADAARMRGFWELPAPEDVPLLQLLNNAGTFQHTIVNTRYRVRVLIAEALPKGKPAGEWFALDQLPQIPLTTITRKALALLHLSPPRNGAMAPPAQV
jgi:A/G-specific adenine glycosylase